VFLSNYEKNNLINICYNIKNVLLDNIQIINNNVHKDFNNTIINYRYNFFNKSEIMLIVNPDYLHFYFKFAFILYLFFVCFLLFIL